ncbi:hypothetical protein [Nocardioides rubriscoriae]|uniref:hypothetical protein n=1 Tax=Nocardioides rubriscoriae TaxID=642762 RepID=UPI0011DF29F9|nr:hypothetical protein [Nocardioides rubriscoriae]
MTSTVDILGFFAATSARTDDEVLRLGDAAFAHAAVTELPTTLSIAVVVVYAAAATDEVSFAIGLQRPDGSRSERRHGLTVVTPGRYAHLDVPVDVFEEGGHALLLHPLADTATTLATYPFGVGLSH